MNAFIRAIVIIGAIGLVPNYVDGANLIQNGSFSDWIAAEPNNWTLQVNRNEIQPILSLFDANNDKRWVVFSALPSGLSAGWLTQQIDLRGKNLQWLRFSCRVRLTGDQKPNRNVHIYLKWSKKERAQLIPRMEYVYSSHQSDDKTYLFTRTFPVVHGSKTLTVAIGQRGGRNGNMAVSDVLLLPAEPPAAKRARVATAYWMPEKTGDWKRNLTGIDKLSAEAAKKGCDLILFGETVTVVSTGRSYVDTAEPVPGHVTNDLARIARRYGIYLATSVYERDGQAVYNTAVLFDKKGKLIGKYRKVHPADSEIIGGVQPGKKFAVFDTELGRIGMQICYDHHIVESARVMALQGAQIILTPIWGDMRSDGAEYEIVARARAIDNGVYYITSNYSNKRSMIIDPLGRILAETSGSKPSLAIADIELNIAHDLDLPFKRPVVFPMKYRMERNPQAYVPLVDRDNLPQQKQLSSTVYLGRDRYQVEWISFETFDDTNSLSKWFVEGNMSVSIRNGKLYAQSTKQNTYATIWYKQHLPQNLLIRFRGTVNKSESISDNRGNLNLFVHARENDGSMINFGRSGVYSEYHSFPNYLLTLVGGNNKSGWSRLRRNPGYNLWNESSERTHIGGTYDITVTVLNGRLRYYVNARLIHDYTDSQPLKAGLFGLRTFQSDICWHFVEFGKLISVE